MQPPEVLDLLAHQHARVQAPLLGHVAEAPSLGLAHGPAVPADTPGVQVDQAEDGAHGRRLARSVGTEKAHHLAGGNGEGEIVEGGDGTVATGETLQLEQATHRFTLGAVMARTPVMFPVSDILKQWSSIASP